VKAKADPTLHEVLAELGYSTQPSGRGNGYIRDVLQDGVVIWQGSAHECWSWLRSSGQLGKDRRTR
jgi:hypothetical protein